MNAVSFDVRQSDAPIAWDGAVEVVPVLDAGDLLELVFRFEQESGFDVPGSYGGILVGGWYLDVGSLADYYLGRKASPLRAPGTIAVLGCGCGDVECWPLYATVTAGDSRVRWSHFRQPFRPERSYQGFGPFVFERGAYERAIEEAVGRLE